MSATMFDTLVHTKKLRDAGVPEAQAEAHAEALLAAFSQNIATKQDLKDLEYRLTIRLGSIMAAGIAVLALVNKL